MGWIRSTLPVVYEAMVFVIIHQLYSKTIYTETVEYELHSHETIFNTPVNTVFFVQPMFGKPYYKSE